MRISDWSSDVCSSDLGMADGVIYHDADGRECFQKAEVVIMACNGVGTPRILLNSRSPQFPDGLANRSGLVGKNLMRSEEHTSELQSLMRISYAVFCLKKKTTITKRTQLNTRQHSKTSLHH